MEKTNPSVYFVYHGGCPDGFFTCLVFDLWRSALGSKDLGEAIRKVFKREEKLTIDEKVAVAGEDGVKPFVGSKSKAPSTDEILSKDVKYFKVIYTATDSNVKDILKAPEQKDILILADIGNLQVLQKLYGSFAEVYFVDHHQTALDEGLSSQDFLKKFPACSFHYDTKVSACRMMYSLLLKYGDDCLQEYYSPSFGENLTKMVNSISLGDVNSLLNLPEEDKRFKSGFCSLTDIMSFSKNGSPVHLRKIANYDYDIMAQMGEKCLQEMEKAIAPELKKAEMGSVTYYSQSLEKEISLSFLMVYSNSKYRSDLGNYLTKMASEEGLDPVAVVYADLAGKPGYFRAGWRALDLPTHQHVNLSEFCAVYKGGGHKHAAGCEHSADDIKKFKAKKKSKIDSEPKKVEIPEKKEKAEEEEIAE